MTATQPAPSAVELGDRPLELEEIEAVAAGARLTVSAAARARVARAREFVEERFASGEAIYGVTTGFGRLANVRVEPKDAGQLQLNLVRSHAAGTGAPLDERLVRAAGVLRARSLAAGHSGIAPATFDLLVELLNRGVTPVVPCQGSVGAMSLEAFLGTDRVFDSRINALRPHPGQERVASNLRALLAGSQIMVSHRECGRVQDPYSFRCIPVVHGAVRDSIEHVRGVTSVEANSVTDNPLVFPDEGLFISGGNFHGEPIALAIDFLKMAVAELAGIGERRLYLLLNAEDRGLPLFLTGRSGLQSGLMIVQYAAAALVNDNKGLCWPSSVDSIPTSAGQEDHVSMGMTSANNLVRVLDNVEGALACELIGALAATDFRRPHVSGAGTQAAYELARTRIAPWTQDRIPAPDIEAARELIRSGALIAAAQAAIGETPALLGGAAATT